MTELYIRCKGCKRKYLNKEENIKVDFGYNRLEERYKSCVKCRENSRKQTEQEITCDNCGCLRNKKSISIHKRRYYCKTFKLEEKPDFETWLKQQEYKTRPWEYKKMIDGEIDIKNYEYSTG